MKRKLMLHRHHETLPFTNVTRKSSFLTTTTTTTTTTRVLTLLITMGGDGTYLPLFHKLWSTKSLDRAHEPQL